MIDFIKSFLKWILIAAIIVGVLLLIVKIADNTEKKAKANNRNNLSSEYESGIQTTNSSESNTNSSETNTNSSNSTRENTNNSTLIVDTPDTASTNGITIGIGTILLGFGIIYIYKKAQ